MSGQWEVVGKSKKDKQSGKNKKMSKDEKRKFVDNAPKVEDLLPLAQVKTLYAALDTNKETPKPVEKAVKTKENEAKKAQKKPKEKKEPVKENKPPKTIEAAVTLITAADVTSVLDVGRARFPAAPLVWLKGLASWLNTKLPVDHGDNAFTAKSWEHPACLLGPEIRTVLKKALKEVPESAVQMFYDYCLTSMANDMTKGSPVSGYKMLLQLIASQTPTVATADLSRAATLRLSYQNRPAIGCSVMWALGQAGYQDVTTGLRVWQHVMLPVYPLRHYTHFVTDYLKHLLARHSTSKTVTAKHYLEIVDAILASPQPANHELRNHLKTLQGIMCNAQPDNSLHNLVEPLLARLSAGSPPAIRDELVRVLCHCLVTDDQSWSEWRKLYTKLLPQSAVLLRHLNADWAGVGSRLSRKSLRETLRTFKAANDDMHKRKLRSEGLQECSRLCESLLAKMSEAKKPFPSKTIVFVVFLAIAGAVTYDSKVHNGFKASKTGVFLKNIGALNYGEQAFSRVKEMSLEAYRWGEANVPVYAARARQTLGPYATAALEAMSALALQLAAVGKAALQFCADKKPVVQQWLNENAPGLIEAVSEGASKAWALTRHYGLEAGTLALKYLSISAEWLKENVFVGKLSPENLQRVTLEALNTTQTLALETMSWINSKMVTSGAEKV